VVLADQPFEQPGTIGQPIRIYREQKPQIVIPVDQGFRGNRFLLGRAVFPELAGPGGGHRAA
jgi:CTP:molybdopterin cytidylyltransferase MocA